MSTALVGFFQSFLVSLVYMIRTQYFIYRVVVGSMMGLEGSALRELAGRRNKPVSILNGNRVVMGGGRSPCPPTASPSLSYPPHSKAASTGGCRCWSTSV